MDEQEYIIFEWKTGGVGLPWVTHHRAIPLDLMARGLQDWSQGQEVIKRITEAEHYSVNIFYCRMTWDRAYAVNAGTTDPPSYKERTQPKERNQL